MFNRRGFFGLFALPIGAQQLKCAECERRAIAEHKRRVEQLNRESLPIVRKIIESQRRIDEIHRQSADTEHLYYDLSTLIARGAVTVEPMPRPTE